MSKYVDTSAIIQVIGSVFKHSDILDDNRYSFIESDFPERFHKILFGTIYNLHLAGAKQININTIEDYLTQRPKQFAIYKTNKGREYLQEIIEKNMFEAFDFYYNRMKKMTLLRAYNEIGLDLDWLYDIDNIFDSKKKQEQEDFLDRSTIGELADLIDERISSIRDACLDSSNKRSEQAGEGVLELLSRLEEEPAIGYPLYGPLVNAIVRGARLKKFYLRSAPTGIGKTRTMIADACNFACNTIYKNGKWIPNGTKEPTLYISTEQEREEIQTMMLAFISDVDEDHIVKNEYNVGEKERIKKAAEILKDSPLYITTLPNFTMKDIENAIKIDIKEHNVKYVCHDYIHSSMAILGEISSQSGVKGLREDNILFMISTRLKDICNEYGVFILSSTQLNGDYRDAKVYDQNLLRGAKAIADKVDVGMIMFDVLPEDLEGLGPLIQKKNLETPNVKIAVYKNRGNKYHNILLWCKANKGTCRFEPMYVTDYSYRLIPVQGMDIGVIEKGEKECQETPKRTVLRIL